MRSIGSFEIFLIVCFLALFLGCAVWALRRKPSAAHGRLTDGDKIVILVLILFFFPAGLVYWRIAADKADALAATKQ
jgi:Na+-translocating ferredoxin:NAD+ oxidoreductase RnfD subunit